MGPPTTEMLHAKAVGLDLRPLEEVASILAAAQVEAAEAVLAAGPALAAGAASMGDRAHIDRAVAHNAAWLPKVSEALAAIGLTVTPSVGNFILVHFPQTPGKTAAEADQHLVSQGIFLRRMEGYGLPGALRMTIGSERANEDTIAALAAFLAGKP